MQKPEPILVAGRFPALLDALLDLLTALSPEDWSRSTALAGWQVKDIVQHLLGDEMGILSGKRDGYSEPHAPFQSFEELVAWINQRNEIWVSATRRLSPDLLCQLMRFSGGQTCAYFASLNPYALGSSVDWAGPEPAPLWLDIAREFTERWHHQQHIREAVGIAGAAQPDFLAPVLAAFVHALPRTYRDVEAPNGTTITLTITGPAGASWTVQREAQHWVLYSGQPPSPDAILSCADEYAWRMFTKGLTPQQARSHTRLSGNLLLAEKALETISILA